MGKRLFRSGVVLRLVVLGLALVGLYGVAVARLSSLHLYPSEAALADIGKRTVEVVYPATRGKIWARRGALLAVDLPRIHVGVDPHFIRREAKNKDYYKGVAMRLALVLNMDRAEILEILERTETRFKYVKKNLRFDEAERVDRLDLKGVRLETHLRRHYPSNWMLAHVLGYIDFERKPRLGVERTMDEFLPGKDGMLITEVKKGGGGRYDRRSIRVEPQEGAQVHLTIDERLQFYVEQALDRALERHKAKRAWAVMMEVKTGHILAMATRPTFDPNDIGNTCGPDGAYLENSCLMRIYEPGSIFKPLTMAIALNEGKFDPHEVIDCERGAWMHRGRLLRDYHPYGEIPGWRVLQKSSNIGSAKVALRVEPAVFERYLRNFGIGARTGVALPLESRGIFAPVQRWNNLTHSRVAIGHGVAVSALQMCNAVNAIANDGYLMKPRIILRVTDTEGRVVFDPGTEVLGEPIRPETARVIRRMMELVVQRQGTARRAALEDERYRVGGKTGTAQKVLPGGGYSDDLNIASFVGFCPVEEPRFTLLVSVDEPRGLRTGGAVAAPVWREIAEQAVPWLQIKPGPEAAEAMELEDGTEVPSFAAPRSLRALVLEQPALVEVESDGVDEE